ncbi:aldehyde ferredoxin oxidoreductase family protein [Chloroflexota bacterium]
MEEAKFRGGYRGKVLRVDLSREKLSEEAVDGATLKKYLGGTGLGAKYLYDEVAPGVTWDDPENRFILAVGPLSGTRIAGSGSFSVVTMGAMSGGATSSQANGYFGAYLKFSGYDAIVVQGKASRPVYLYVHDGTAELRDASYLKGKTTWETERLIKEEVNKPKRESSVFSIGPAGENLVRFACLVGDEGHVAAHNGIGAVAGAKNLKAVVAARGDRHLELADEAQYKALAVEYADNLKNSPGGKGISEWGTSLVYDACNATGALPVKNYTTSIFPEADKFSGKYHRSHFEIEANPCWACPTHHCNMMTVTEGPYTGFVGEEPEYEGWASWSCVIGQTDPGAAVMLSNEVDNLGMDTNEAGWVIAWLMECLEKGILTTSDTGGLEIPWGDAAATKTMLQKIASRDGIGDLLAEGVMRASLKIGGEAPNMGIYTMKGNTPRSHDHRAVWWEMFDTCVSNTGTIENLSRFPREQLGLPGVYDVFSPEEVSTLVAKCKGAMAVEDSVVLCRFASCSDLALQTKLLNAATGWDLTVDDVMGVGRRTVNLMKVFNLRHGIPSELDAPSPRYGSVPVDGPAAGKAIMPHWNDMLQNYYKHMGWDEKGVPFPETLKGLGLESVISR